MATQQFPARPEEEVSLEQGTVTGCMAEPIAIAGLAFTVFLRILGE